MKSFKQLIKEETDNHEKRMGLASNHDTPFAVLRHLVSHSMKASNNSTPQDVKNNKDLRLTIVKNPKSIKFDDGHHTTSLHHKILDAKENHTGTYEYMGRIHANSTHPTSVKILDRMSEHHNQYARKTAADIEPFKYFDRLKDDKSEVVHASLAKTFPENYDNDQVPLGARIVAGMSLHGHKNELEDRVHELPLAIRRYVARHTTRYATMDSIINKEKHPRVREALARNPHALQNHIRILANTDPDKKTRKLAITSLSDRSMERLYPKDKETT